MAQSKRGNLLTRNKNLFAFLAIFAIVAYLITLFVKYVQLSPEPLPWVPDWVSKNLDKIGEYASDMAVVALSALIIAVAWIFIAVPVIKIVAIVLIITAVTTIISTIFKWTRKPVGGTVLPDKTYDGKVM